MWYSDIDTTSIQKNIKLAENVKAPVKKGEKLGEIELKLSDEQIAVIDLVASTDVERSFLKFNLSMTKKLFQFSMVFNCDNCNYLSLADISGIMYLGIY